MAIKGNRRELHIIYDVTWRCPWKCPICCMDAQSDRGVLKDELPFARKLALMDELAEVNENRDVYIDFSGGEIFTNPEENLKVMERAACILGRDKIGVSCSGFALDDQLAEQLAHVASECEMTMDTPPGAPYAFRPMGYALAAAHAVEPLQHYGIRVGIQTVLAASNCTEDNLSAVYSWLCEHNVDNWSLLRFYPSGRGAKYPEQRLSAERECWAVQFIQSLDRQNHAPRKPVVDFHYTIKGHSKYSCECRCVRRSIGILPNGDVTACFWAVGENHVVLPEYLLGSLRKDTLPQILAGDAARYWDSTIHYCGLRVA